VALALAGKTLDKGEKACYTVGAKQSRNRFLTSCASGAVVNTSPLPASAESVGLFCAGIGFGIRFDFILEVFQY
jgi:hypothetical protein